MRQDAAGIRSPLACRRAAQRTAPVIARQLVPACALFVAALASCSSLLGIEELHQEAAGGGAAQDAGTDASAEGSAGGRSDAGVATAPADGSAGTPGVDSDGSVDVVVRLDASAAADAGTMLDATTADDAPPDGNRVEASRPPADASSADGPRESSPALITVRGHLIDAWRHDLPGAPVLVGTQTTITDATGHFMLTNVATPYDVGVVINGTSASNVATQGWLYQGLRRADPTLQVYAALPARSNRVITRFTNVTFPLPDRAEIVMAFGSPDASATLFSTASEAIDDSVDWRGPVATSGTLHALRVVRSTLSSPLSTTFEAYAAHPATIDETVSTAPDIAFDVAPTTVATSSITGTVASSAVGDPTNAVFVRFPSGAALLVTNEAKGNGAFSYPVPALSGATITFTAERGAYNVDAPYALAHADAVAPGTAIGVLTIPTPPTLTAPVTGATAVTTATSFGWTGAAGVSIAVFSFDAVDANLFVVTAAPTATIPVFTGTGLSLPANARALGTWRPTGPMPPSTRPQVRWECWTPSAKTSRRYARRRRAGC